MRRRTAKQLLLTLIAVGGLASLTTGGTYAVFTSRAANANNSVASGTLTFSNTVNTGTACLSQNGPASPGNVNPGCDVLLTSSSLWYPVTSPVTAGQASITKVTIKNTGSLAASKLSLYMPSCTAGPSPGAPAGGGNPCSASGGLDLYVQETDSSWNPTTCWWPQPAAPGACSLSDNTLGGLAQVAYDSTHTYSLGAGPAAQGTRYFQIGLAEPVDADNTLQGEAATFALTWHMDS